MNWRHLFLLNPVGGGNSLFIAFIGQSLTHTSHSAHGLKFFKGLSDSIKESVSTTPR